MTRNIFEEARETANILKALSEMSLNVGAQWKENIQDKYPEAVIKRSDLKQILKWIKLEVRITKEDDILDFFKKVVEEDLKFKTSVVSTNSEIYFTMESKW